MRGVEVAIKGESHHPVACADTAGEKLPMCQIEVILQTERPSLVDRYRERVEEYATLPPARFYCANTKCAEAQGSARSLNADIHGDRVICPDYNNITCVECREAVYTDGTNDGHTCTVAEKDAAIYEYLTSIPEHERWLWQK